MAALLGGIGALVLGILGIVFWFSEFIDLLQGGVPIMLLLGGALAIYLGFEEIRDKSSADTLGDTNNGLKQEVESLKEEIKDLKEEKAPSEEE